MNATILTGNCLDILPTLDDNSVDAVVTDPPYGLSAASPDTIAEAVHRWAAGERDYTPTGVGFMGKSWDAFVPPPAVWDDCLRVLKPGGHMLVFAGSRTVDLMGLSIRLAGFEIRDTIAWVYGSGFPKSLDVSKAIDKAAGAERAPDVVEDRPGDRLVYGGKGAVRCMKCGNSRNGTSCACELPAPATPAAQQWQGWGTALKPAIEPVILARKPIEGTVAANVLRWGTGAINVDGCRVATADLVANHARGSESARSKGIYGDSSPQNTHQTPGQSLGRWPANVLLSEEAAGELDADSGVTRDGIHVGRNRNGDEHTNEIYGARKNDTRDVGYGGSGGASRFFPVFKYQAKASSKERPRIEEDGRVIQHPTVKPVDLMRWLCRLITPPDGIVLDPFAGSGTTIEAALLEGFAPIGIEREPDYVRLIEQRIARVPVANEGYDDELTLFDGGGAA